MKRFFPVIAGVTGGLIVGGLVFAFIVWHGQNFQVLNTHGLIAGQQRDLFIFTLALSMVVVVPVFALLAIIAWRFRSSNTKAKYRPDWDGNRVLESIWWGLPLALIIILSSVIITSSHDLDPYRPLVSSKKPLHVQVVALQWKWLFIYPDQGVASLGELHIPVDTPVNFDITSDAPMNSFWIPRLGGQVYAMSGMSTQLHLMADDEGQYPGSSANISGKGFASMKFTANVTSGREFETWVSQTKRTAEPLDKLRYDSLAKPSENMPRASYLLMADHLYDTIVMKYMSDSMPEHDHDSMMAEGVKQ